MRNYRARVWPARPGCWDDQPYVAEVHAGSIDDAIRVLLEDDDVHRALVEEDPRLENGWLSSDEYWCEEWPDRADVFIYPAEGSFPDDHPVLVVEAFDRP